MRCLDERETLLEKDEHGERVEKRERSQGNKTLFCAMTGSQMGQGRRYILGPVRIVMNKESAVHEEQ